jgi:serine phosphatase RsbU (regulator of sigma subunit)
MFRKLRNQLLFTLLLFVAINFLVIFISQSQANMREQITTIENRIHEFELLIYKDAQQINKFFSYETYNPNFFITQQSEFISKHKLLSEQIKNAHHEIFHSKEFLQLNITHNSDSIAMQLESLELIFDSITKLVFIRGFKDWGLEGSMREFAHKLEQDKAISLSDLLMLRRHEKDYIIRNELKYREKFLNKMQSITNELTDSVSLITTKGTKTLEDLQNYKTSFIQIVQMDSIIGIKNNAAFKAQLDSTINQLLFAVKRLSSNCSLSKQKSFKQIRIATILSLLIYVAFAFYLSLKFSKLTTRRISKLSENISGFIESGFNSTEAVAVKTRRDEVGLLIENFELLKHKITAQIEDLEIKVAERTEEINTQKDQLMLQNKKIVDSVRYAMNIQEAILPPKNAIQDIFPECFIFYSPKDLVSGDFYWFKNINNSDLNISLIAIADCTGHGVPGGFMSMLGIAFLNDFVIKKDSHTTAWILDKLRQKVTSNLAQLMHTKRLSDGMDVALVLIDHKKKTVQFSGANRDLLLIRNKQMHVFKGDKLTIGKNIRKEDKNFSLHEFPFYPNDTIYMYTDGFTDQFGGPKGYKYLNKNLKNLLLNASTNTMSQQKQLIRSEFNQWKGKLEQTDDILVAGFKL